MPMYSHRTLCVPSTPTSATTCRRRRPKRRRRACRRRTTPRTRTVITCVIMHCVLSPAGAHLTVVALYSQPKKRIFTEEGLAGRREGQRPPTAVMTHGDIIAWSHGETELEQAEHQPHGKHHSLQKKVEVRAQAGRKGERMGQGLGDFPCAHVWTWLLGHGKMTLSLSLPTPGHAAVRRHSGVGRGRQPRAGRLPQPPGPYAPRGWAIAGCRRHYRVVQRSRRPHRP